jgi:hypothetical protein
MSSPVELSLPEGEENVYHRRDEEAAGAFAIVCCYGKKKDPSLRSG